MKPNQIEYIDFNVKFSVVVFQSGIMYEKRWFKCNPSNDITYLNSYFFESIFFVVVIIAKTSTINHIQILGEIIYTIIAYFAQARTSTSPSPM